MWPVEKITGSVKYLRRKDLEITLSVNVKGFNNPKVEYEQYQTPPRVAANLIHRAQQLGDITGKKVIDLCAGTGILGIAASILDASVTTLEIDAGSCDILKQNIELLDLDVTLINEDIFKYEPLHRYDTCVINPPFGIQQKKYRDMDFIKKSANFANVIYSIHDGSETNQQKLPQLFEKSGFDITEMYIDGFPLSNSYSWHKQKRKMYQVLIIRSVFAV